MQIDQSSQEVEDIEKKAISICINKWENHFFDANALQYQEELQKMVHAFGDSSYPNNELLNLLEILAKCYLDCILEKLVNFNGNMLLVWIIAFFFRLCKTLRMKAPSIMEAEVKPAVKFEDIIAVIPENTKFKLFGIATFVNTTRLVQRTHNAIEKGSELSSHKIINDTRNSSFHCLDRTQDIQSETEEIQTTCNKNAFRPESFSFQKHCKFFLFALQMGHT